MAKDKLSDVLRLDQQLCFSIYSTSLAVMQAYKPMLEQLGLTYPQYLVMLVLWEGDGITLKHLSERLHLDPGSLTPIVKRLEAEGLLLRQRDAQDERNLALKLTPRGRSMRTKGVQVNQAFGRACGLSDDGLAELRQTLTGLRNHLEG